MKNPKTEKAPEIGKGPQDARGADFPETPTAVSKNQENATAGRETAVKQTSPEPPQTTPPFRAGVIGIYGNTAIPRIKCPGCKRTAFVVDGHFTCCDEPFDAQAITATKRMSSVVQPKAPPAVVARQIIEAQHYKCLFCQLSLVTGCNLNNGKRHRLKRMWLVTAHPFVLEDSCFAAACQICYRIAFVYNFPTLDDMRGHTALRRQIDGWAV